MLPGKSNAKFDCRVLKKVTLSLLAYVDTVWLYLKTLGNYSLGFSVFTVRRCFTKLM